jgi:hypothetical protein
LIGKSNGEVDRILLFTIWQKEKMSLRNNIRGKNASEKALRLKSTWLFKNPKGSQSARAQ